MIHRRNLLLLASLVVGVALVTSTGGVSSMTVDRGVHARVVEDQYALLGFEQNATNTTNDVTDLEVAITNQFPSGTDLTVVEVTVNGTTVDLAESDSLEPGESATHTFATVPCDDTIAVDASGNAVRVYLDRSVTCN